MDGSRRRGRGPDHQARRQAAGETIARRLLQRRDPAVWREMANLFDSRRDLLIFDENRREPSMDGVARPTTKMIAPLGWIAVWGPGLLVMLADTDAGNFLTGAQARPMGYRLLPLLLLLAPMLYMVQELTVRLGLFTGRGHGELICERFGVGWAWLSTAGLAAAG